MPPKGQILAKKWTLKIFGRKRLTMGTLRSKRPLIVIVALHKSCIVNRQSGVGDSKYVVFRDPYLWIM